MSCGPPELLTCLPRGASHLVSSVSPDCSETRTPRPRSLTSGIPFRRSAMKTKPKREKLLRRSPLSGPKSTTKKQIDVAASVRQVPAAALQQIEGGLRALYRTLELHGKNPLKEAHTALDTAVLAAYGFDPKNDLLAQLLELNLAASGRERAGEPVTAPGVPPSYSDSGGLITDDCIRP